MTWQIIHQLRFQYEGLCHTLRLLYIKNFTLFIDSHLFISLKYINRIKLSSLAMKWQFLEVFHIFAVYFCFGRSSLPCVKMTVVILMTTYKIFTAIAHNHGKCKTMTKTVWFRCLRSVKASAAEKRTITNRKSPHGCQMR